MTDFLPVLLGYNNRSHVIDLIKEVSALRAESKFIANKISQYETEVLSLA